MNTDTGKFITTQKEKSTHLHTCILKLPQGIWTQFSPIIKAHVHLRGNQYTRVTWSTKATGWPQQGKFRIHCIDFTISSYFSISSEQTHVSIFRFLPFLAAPVQLTHKSKHMWYLHFFSFLRNRIFITKLSEVNSSINQALGKQTAPLPRFNSVHSVVKQDFYILSAEMCSLLC